MAEPVTPHDDPGARGSLTLRQRAVQRLATQAALETDGVVPHRRGVGKLTGHELPRSDVVVAGDRVWASVDIAVEWGRPLGATALAVQGRVAHTLAEISGLRVDGVDVHVASVIAAPGAKRALL